MINSLTVCFCFQTNSTAIHQKQADYCEEERNFIATSKWVIYDILKDNVGYFLVDGISFSIHLQRD